MYAFVESWIPELLGLSHEKYHLSDETSCSIIFKDDYMNVFQAFRLISQDPNSNDGIGVNEIAANVRGMRILLMKYWVDESILFSLTDGDIKTASQFVRFMSLPNPRFNFEELKRQLVNKWETYITGRRVAPATFIDHTINVVTNADIQVQQVTIEPAHVGIQAQQVTIEPAPMRFTDEEMKIAAVVIPELKPKPVEVKIDEGEKFIKDIINLDSFDGDMEMFKMENGRSVIFNSGTSKPWRNTIISELLKLNKNIVFTDCLHSKISTLLKKRDPVEIQKHTLIFDLNPGHSHNASLFLNDANSSRVPHYNGSMCLGEKIRKSYIVKGSNVNSELISIRTNSFLTPEEKKVKTDEVLKRKLNSPFFKYDCVFKDTYTGTVFAVKKRCMIHLLFCMYEENTDLLKKCLEEIARRIDMNIPYEELFKIDKGYFEKLESNNMQEYVDFAVTSSKELYNNAVADRDRAKDEFNTYMDKAMSAAKVMQRHQDMINAFDLGTYSSKEQEKAKMTYMDTLKIDKVSTIYIDDEQIHVYTKNLYAKDTRTKKYHDIGTFHIIIGMMSSSYNQTDTVRIFNTKYLGMGMNNKFQAPHVWDDGHICHGNLIAGMIEAYKNRNLFDLVYQIIIFLETANTADGAGQCVDTWPEVTEDEALGRCVSNDVNFLYAPKTEAEKKFDAVLADALPITIKP